MGIRPLTQAEENVMQILWQLEKATVKEIIDLMPAPKPAYNTVSTVIRVLEKKKVIGHTSEGNSHIYHALVTEAEYMNFSVNKVLKNYFNSSYKNLVSFLVEKPDMSSRDIAELEALIKTLKKTKS
jgi:BlaI family transcriptional regulator, penicillinase repressor